jgi:hypothetical protein
MGEKGNPYGILVRKSGGKETARKIKTEVGV